MPAVTYLSQHEAEAGRTVPDAKDCNELLQEVRKVTGEEWIIRVHTYQTKRKLFRKQRTVKFYSLYYGMPNGVEWQCVNLASPEGGTIFHPSEVSRELVLNFLMGLRNGYEECAAKLGSLANLGAAKTPPSIEQPHQSKIPTQPQGEGEPSP